MTDPISDYLTRLRNAIKAQHRVVEIPASNLKKEITRVLYEKGYILKYKFEDTDNKQGVIKIALKYNNQTRLNAISQLKRISTPGLRKYSASNDLPKVLERIGYCNHHNFKRCNDR